MPYNFHVTDHDAAGESKVTAKTAEEMSALLSAIILGTLPTSDPVSAGAVYNVDGVLTVSEGGGGLTELFKLDFVTAANSHVNGTPVAIADNVQEDATDWGSTFDLSDIVPATGWVMDSNYGFAFDGAVLALVLAGCTIVVDFSVEATSVVPRGNKSYFPFDVISLDFSISNTAFTQEDFSGINDGSGGHVDNSASPFIAGANKYAATMDESLIALSINGDPAVAIPNPAWGVIEWADIYWHSPIQADPPLPAGVCTIRSITGYAPQLAVALPALSAS